MPIYEYRCQACGTVFEELRLSSAGSTKVKCSACSSDQVIKLLSAGTIRQGRSPSPSAPAPSCQGRGGFS